MIRPVSALFLAVALCATAAHAQRSNVRWTDQPLAPEIASLPREIDQAVERRFVTPRQAAALRRDAADLRRLHDRYARGGLDGRERADLNQRLHQLRQGLRREADRRRDVPIETRAEK
jgi:hypothetical protein